MEHKSLGDNESIQLLNEANNKGISYEKLKNALFDAGYRNKNGSLTISNVSYHSRKNRNKKVLTPIAKPNVSVKVILENVFNSDLNTKKKLAIIEQLIS